MSTQVDRKSHLSVKVCVCYTTQHNIHNYIFAKNDVAYMAINRYNSFCADVFGRITLCLFDPRSMKGVILL